MKQNMKALLAAVLMTGMVAAGSYGLTEAAEAAENGKAVVMQTGYAAAPETAPDDVSYMWGSYDGTVAQTLTMFKKTPDAKPTANDIPEEDAAETGTRRFNAVFGVDLTGKEIAMEYSPAYKGIRAVWTGTCAAPDAEYSFSVDAVTGEVLNVLCNRDFPDETLAGFEAEDKYFLSYEACKAVAEEMVVKHGAISRSIKNLVRAVSSGFVDSDPYFVFDFAGADGETAQATVSRYDKHLTGIYFDAGMKWKAAESAVTIAETDELQARADAYFEANPGTTLYYDEELRGQIEITPRN
ncbi:MAG: hypothetical protein LBR83_02335 [Clostridiales bacterium]|jgi:hypothetical protein|nr:hypothetical protein [Clostridiales bacterium]